MSVQAKKGMGRVDDCSLGVQEEAVKTPGVYPRVIHMQSTEKSAFTSTWSQQRKYKKELPSILIHFLKNTLLIRLELTSYIGHHFTSICIYEELGVVVSSEQECFGGYHIRFGSLFPLDDPGSYHPIPPPPSNTRKFLAPSRKKNQFHSPPL